jgi:hypothetical protein
VPEPTFSRFDGEADNLAGIVLGLERLKGNTAMTHHEARERALVHSASALAANVLDRKPLK